MLTFTVPSLQAVVLGVEFVLKKGESNKKKQGIDFNQAQALRDVPEAIEIPARTSDQSRFLIIGKISGKHS